MASDTNDRSNDRKKNILVLDDDESIRNYLIKLLFRYGYSVQAAATPKQADQVLRAAKQPFDLIITDIQMPTTSGVDFLVSLPKTDPPIPAIVLSGMIQPNHILQLKQLKEVTLHSMLVKPVKSSTLIDKINEILGPKSVDSEFMDDEVLQKAE